MLGVDTTFPYGDSLEVNASGVYQIYAIASDDDGNDIVSTVHRLTVVEPSEPVRELEIRADSTNIGADATISATYKSPSGTYDSSLRALVYVDGDYVGDAILSSYVAPLPWEEDPGQSLTYELPARIAGSVDVEMVIINGNETASASTSFTVEESPLTDDLKFLNDLYEGMFQRKPEISNWDISILIYGTG